MLLTAAILLTVGAIVFTLSVRPKDVPPPEPESPTEHLETRRARIYESLRDLQFEYRVGKLSDADYQSTKTGLQQELAAILAEIDRIGAQKPTVVKAAQQTPAANPPANVCPHCGAQFKQALKFCGECGKPMTKATA
jgi:hypothetical protein